MAWQNVRNWICAQQILRPAKTVRIRTLTGVFAGCTCYFVGFAVLCLIFRFLAPMLLFFYKIFDAMWINYTLQTSIITILLLVVDIFLFFEAWMCTLLPKVFLYFSELNFQCLATWDNGDKYLYGSFSEPWMTNEDEYSYRCFVSTFYLSCI